MVGQASVALALSVAFLTASGTQASRDEVRCTYSRRQVCTRSGCEANPVGQAFLVIPALARIRAAMLDGRPVDLRRCDGRGCTPVTTMVSESGDFLILSAPRSGYLFKVATVSETLSGLRAGEFVEVATQILTTYVGFGRCQVTG